MTPHPPDLSAFGSFQILRPFTTGHRNQVWLATDGHANWVAKTTRRSEAALVWAEQAMAHARGVGLLTPEFLHSADGTITHNGLTVETYLPGTPFPARALPDLAAPLRAFRKSAGAMPQRPGFMCLTKLLMSQRGGDVDLDAMPPELVAKLCAAWQPISQGPKGVLHGDLGATNILLSPAGVPGLIDWDECRYDLCFFDEFPLIPKGRAHAHEILAHRAWECANSWQTEPEYARKLAALL